MRGQHVRRLQLLVLPRKLQKELHSFRHHFYCSLFVTVGEPLGGLQGVRASGDAQLATNCQ